MKVINYYLRYLFFVYITFIIFNCGPQNNTENARALALLFSGNSSPKANFVLREEMADTIISAPYNNGESFRDQNSAINGVRGSGLFGGSLDVFSLAQTGTGAEMIVSWSGREIYNGDGIDFVIFENPWIIGSDSNVLFIEPTIVEVSRDNISYCGFNPSFSSNQYSRDPSNWLRFAGLKPVLYNEDSNKLPSDSIFNVNQSGGDGFDLSDLSDDNFFNIGCNTTVRDSIKNNGFKYLKLTAASSRINSFTNNYFPIDSASTSGPDIDGVSARYRR
jgi:hypothetical protein